MTNNINWQSFGQWGMGIVIIFLMAWNGIIMTKFTGLAETIKDLEVAVAVLNREIEYNTAQNEKNVAAIEHMVKELAQLRLDHK